MSAVDPSCPHKAFIGITVWIEKHLRGHSNNT
jgi:hypothetical protein